MPIRSNSQKTGKIGVNIIDSMCEELDFMFREMHEDYGIDGEIELMKKDQNLDEKVQIQVKSSGRFKRKKNGMIGLLPIERKHLKYWNDSINIPVFLIAVELSTRRIYWLDTTSFYKKIIKTENKSITVEVNPKNILNLQNKDAFIRDFKRVNIATAKRVLSRHSTHERIRQVGKKKGYDITEKADDTSILLTGTELSKTNPIVGTLKVDRKISHNSYKINDFRLKIGDEVVEEIPKGIMSVIESYEDLDLYLNAGGIEYKVHSEKTLVGNKGIIKSKKGELFQLEIIIDIPTSKITLNVDHSLIEYRNFEEAHDVLEFLNKVKEGLSISILNLKGRKSLLVESKSNFFDNDDHLKLTIFTNLIYKIEQKYKLNFPINKILNGNFTWDTIDDLMPKLKGILYDEYVENQECIFLFDINKEISKEFHSGEHNFIFSFIDFELLGVKLPITLNVDVRGHFLKELDRYKLISSETKFFTEK